MNDTLAQMQQTLGRACTVMTPWPLGSIKTLAHRELITFEGLNIVRGTSS